MPATEAANLTKDLNLEENRDAMKQAGPAPADGRWRRLALAASGLALGFAVPLWQLIYFTAHSELYSYILLIPFISGYLVWIKRRNLAAFVPARGKGAAFLAAGTLVLIWYWLVLRSQVKLAPPDYLAVMMSSFLLCFFGLCCLCLGTAAVRAAVFPLGFLLFLIPLPAAALAWIDGFLQWGSAPVVQAFFDLAMTPYVRDGLVFQLPTITIQIAPECSGIHSSLVLLITSVLASHLFLRTPWKRAFFVLAVIPLALLRNGFRVFTIGELCVHIGPQMIDSPIHHKGGPIFFALSLIPLFILLILLQNSERRKQSSSPSGENPG